MLDIDTCCVCVFSILVIRLQQVLGLKELIHRLHPCIMGRAWEQG